MKISTILPGIVCLIAMACSTSSSTIEPIKEEPVQPSIDRPIPNPIPIPDSFYGAIDRGTRTLSGVPGHNYWTNWTEYVMDLELIPEEKTLKGSVEIKYYNNSPDTLNLVVVELAQNLHKEGEQRLEAVEITGGIQLGEISNNGIGLEEIDSFRPGYTVQGTNLIIVLTENLEPGTSTNISIDWEILIPQQGASSRMGYNADNLFYLAYYFPHMAVYDDVEGWFTDPFTANAEFYHGFGDYKINITAPDQWLVQSTGELLNAEEVLTESVYKRYVEAGTSDEVVNIATKDDFGNITKSNESGESTWKFEAKNVRDVAFSATSESNWDGTRTPIGDIDGDGEIDYSRIFSVWRDLAPFWKDEAVFAAHSIKFLSKYTGIPYPWPHMTSVEGSGIIGGGMEFPMMTIMGDYNQRGSQALYDVTAHELAHMWLPMIVSSNERRYAWMDEGSTTFHEANARWDFYPNSFDRELEFSGYLGLAGTEFEGEIMRRSDYHYLSQAYGVASYPKPATGLLILQGILGEEMFTKAWKTYMHTWKYKHPTPFDMFKTFETVSGQDLNYFWRGFYFETWTLDQSIGSVEQTENSVTITIEDLGDLILPVLLTVTLEDGTVLNERIEADAWLLGSRTASITLDIPSPVSEIVIDKNTYFPDMYRSNNIWTK